MRALVTSLLLLGFLAADGQTALSQQGCKVCADQKKACMKNYTGPACSTEYTMCMKSCQK
jgi:hypothetical protein